MWTSGRRELTGEHANQGSTGVPAPWAPLVVEGKRISVWGRDYDVSGGLPTPCSSAGVDLLAGPVVLAVDGRPVEGWRTSAVEGDARAAAWSADADADGSGDLAAHLEGRIDYDGFAELRLRITGGPIESAAIEMPVRTTRGLFFHHVLEIPPADTNTLALPDSEGVLWQGPFQSGVWLGDDEAGIEWCADDPRAFDLAEPGRAVEVVRSGDVTTLRINLLDHAVDRVDLDVRFGIVATPMRPRPSGWRGWQVSPGRVANIDVRWWPDWTDSHANTVPNDPAALRADAAEARSAGRALLPYFAMEILSADAEPFSEGRAMRWRIEPAFANADEGSRYWLVCPNTPWAEHLVDEIVRVIEECGLSGVYLDFFMPMPCSSLDHGCGYLDTDGVASPSYNVFAFRAMAKRLYERVKAAAPDALLMVHTGDAMLYSSISFGDLMLNGEYKRKQLAQSGGSYVDVLPAAELRAAFRGEHTGLAPFLLPEFATPEGAAHPQWASDRRRTRELLLLTLAHDVAVWPIYCDVDTVDEARAALADIRPTAEFVGYWEPKAVAFEADNAGVLVSGWLGSSSAVVVANPTDDPAHVVICDPRFDGERRAVDVGPRDYGLVTAR